uniref:Uncharacterized protein n=1 Tax=Arundo donax TaxID=35708 RepID=A0A0A9A4X6_ARUDO
MANSVCVAVPSLLSAHRSASSIPTTVTQWCRSAAATCYLLWHIASCCCAPCAMSCSQLEEVVLVADLAMRRGATRWWDAWWTSTGTAAGCWTGTRTSWRRRRRRRSWWTGSARGAPW